MGDMCKGLQGISMTEKRVERDGEGQFKTARQMCERQCR